MPWGTVRPVSLVVLTVYDARRTRSVARPFGYDLHSSNHLLVTNLEENALFSGGRLSSGDL